MHTFSDNNSSACHPTIKLLILFFLSGCAALIYEVVWLQLLRLIIGSSAISLGLLLASYMGGLLLGSLFLSYFISINHHPLKIYAFLEFLIGLLGLAILFVLPIVREIYYDNVGYGMLNLLIRSAICAICLLPPTICMGATLPAIARWFEASSTGISKLGHLYGANILGAVTGTFLAGFYLLPEFDIKVATYVAVLLNICISISAFSIASKCIYTPAVREENKQKADNLYLGPVCIVSALSGLTALGAQVVWTRIMSLYFGVTTYTFTIILAVFLSGLGFGSHLASFIVKKGKNPKLLLTVCQLLLVPSIAYAAYMIAKIIPGMSVVISDQIFKVHLSNIWSCFISILPATLLWGASFPLALAAVGFKEQDPSRISGYLYAANTSGSILGALLFTLILIPNFGTQGSQWALIILATGSGVLMLCLYLNSQIAEKEARWLNKIRLAQVIGAIIILVVNSLLFVPAVSDVLLGYGLRKISLDKKVFPFVKEGISSTVAVQGKNNKHSLHVSGRIVASTELEDMRLQRMMGHIPGIIHENPKSVLIVGLGTGVTSGSFAIYPGIERIVICEIEPAVYQAALQYFSSYNHNILNNPKVELIFDDARHYLATTKEKFDIVTSDPIHPWVRGAASLFSVEFYELVKTKLNPGGVVAQWLPLYETSQLAVQIQMKTFINVFDNSSVWTSNVGQIGHDIILIGQLESLQFDVKKKQKLLNDNKELRRSLAGVHIDSAKHLYSSYVCNGQDLKSWVNLAPLNRDISLKLEYVAGLALNKNLKSQIIADIRGNCISR